MNEKELQSPTIEFLERSYRIGSIPLVVLYHYIYTERDFSLGRRVWE
jgi:hypothetical protein